MALADFASAFAVVLKKHREAAGFSQEALAERADIHPTHIGLIERSKRNPSLNVVKALADALGVSLADLVQEAEELTRKKGR